MRVYGLDFTSAPKKGKPLTLAKCDFDGSQLIVEKKGFHEFGDKELLPFEDYQQWVKGEGQWKETDWIAGIDFPFGLPLGAIAKFGWVPELDDSSWDKYVAEIFRRHPTLDVFIDSITSWVYPDVVTTDGKAKKIQPKRMTDQVAGSQSPARVDGNPPVGAMFYKGCNALLDAGILIPPVHVESVLHKTKVAIEAYPKLVAQKFLPGDQKVFDKLIFEKERKRNEKKKLTRKKKLTQNETKKKDRLVKEIKSLNDRIRPQLKYKEETGSGSGLKKNRECILDGLSDQNHEKNKYGLELYFADPKDRRECIRDAKGDLLDSVLCAVQAAWAYKHRDSGYGVPSFSKQEMLQKQILLEGWIVDPAMTNMFGASS